MKNVLRAGLLLALFLVSAACATAPGDSTELLAGTYQVTLSKDQLLEVGSGSVLAQVAAGTWQLELTEGGEARLSQETTGLGMNLREGWPYTLSGGKITLQPSTGEYACPVPGAVGSYNWAIEGGQLHLSVIEDQCDRKYVLIAQPWAQLP